MKGQGELFYDLIEGFYWSMLTFEEQREEYENSVIRLAAIAHQKIYPLKPLLRLPKWAGGKQMAVAKTPLSVNHTDFNRPG